MKNYVFEVSESFKDLVATYGIEDISPIDIGEECEDQGIIYRKLIDWDYDSYNGTLDIYVENY